MRSRLGRRLLKIAGWALAVLLAGAGIAAWATGIVGMPRVVGFYSPIFEPDGGAIFVVRRELRALVTGFGYEFFSPPATVRYRDDRFALLRITVSDGTVSVVEAFQPSPLEGTSVESYHGALFGRPDVHLRWADPAHLDYEIAVTRPSTPFSRTFVTRRTWDARASRFVATAPWEEGPTRMAGGDDPHQLHGDLEVIAVPGAEAVPCAVVLLRTGEPAGRPLLETTQCRKRHPEGYALAELSALSRRKEIEKSEHVRTTYAELIERGRRAGLPEGEAYLAAGREMERLGLFPKTPKLMASPANCGDAQPLFTISDEEFRVGLFQDIERAVAAPGEAVEKDDRYIRHNAYTTSRQINDYLDAGHTQFFVKARGSCWQMTIDK